MLFQHELEIMLSAAQSAGKLAMKYFSTDTLAEEKDDMSPVTIADRESERLISGILSSSFPEDGILGEEGASRPCRSGRRWLIDPIDGTRDFVRRNSFWSVQIALQDEDRIVMGSIFFPCLNRMLYAVSGGGCYWNHQQVHVSDMNRLDKAVLLVSALKSAWDVFPPVGVRLLTERCWMVRSYGGSFDVAMLARGKADIWLSGNGMEWDYASARVIAQECGAKFLTKDGTDRINARNCLICSPGLEQELRRILEISST
jgi:histidinol-phosphatase